MLKRSIQWVTGLIGCCIAPSLLATPFNGFYLNAGAGVVNLEAKISQHGEVNLLGGTTVVAPYRNHVSQNSALGTVGLGYQISNRRVMLGIEGVVNFEDAKVMDQTTAFESGSQFTLKGNATAKLTYDFAVLFTPGVVVGGRTSLYALVGPRWGFFQSSAYSQFGFMPPFPSSFTVQGSRSNYKAGVSGGFGISTYLADHFTASVEYAYTYYGVIAAPTNLSGNAFFSGFVVAKVKRDVQINAQTNVATINFAYHF